VERVITIFVGFGTIISSLFIPIRNAISKLNWFWKKVINTALNRRKRSFQNPDNLFEDAMIDLISKIIFNQFKHKWGKNLRCVVITDTLRNQEIYDIIKFTTDLGF